MNRKMGALVSYWYESWTGIMLVTDCYRAGNGPTGIMLISSTGIMVVAHCYHAGNRSTGSLLLSNTGTMLVTHWYQSSNGQTLVSLW